MFLQYQVFKFVDLRDVDRTDGDSRQTPVKDPLAQTGFNMKYRQFFSPEFAAHYGIRDPRNARRFLRLDELLDGGYVHEVWFFLSGNEAARRTSARSRWWKKSHVTMPSFVRSGASGCKPAMAATTSSRGSGAASGSGP